MAFLMYSDLLFRRLFRPAFVAPGRAGLCLLLMLIAVTSRAQSLQLQLSSAEGEPVSGAVIELLLPEAMRADYQQPQQTAIDQVDKEFVPHISTVVIGSEVSFPNSDDILHHVYSFSEANTFNIPLYGRGENDDYFEVFPRPGIVEIGCNIHDWMLAYIYVGETSLMAVTDENGLASLQDLPAGNFQLRLWHERLASDGNVLLEDLSLTEGETAELQLSIELQRDRRLRRAPSANRSRYR